MESIKRESNAGAALSVLSLIRLIEKAAILKKKKIAVNSVLQLDS